MVDLRAKPYCLTDGDIAWVQNTIASMTDEEKVGQLFFQLTAGNSEEYLRELMEKYHLGGCRYNGMPGEKVLEQNRILQKYAKIPVFIACNPEQGGSGVCPDGTGEGLESAHVFADVAVVSSANRDAVEEEWTNHHLLDHVDILLAQDCGSKAHCIAQMLKFGYAPDHVLMVGDAPGDCDAAETNGVLYFPILVNREGESWTELRETALGKLHDGTYAGAYAAEKKQQFLHNLGG